MRPIFRTAILIAALLVFRGLVAARAAGFDSYTLDPHDETLDLFWLGPDGKPIRTFARLASVLEGEGRAIKFAMNAGIYEPGYIPTGLTIASGKVLVPLNEKPGRGNFYFRPNGVFFIENGRPRILETSRYVAARLHPQLATQSGPMLVENGRINPAFARNSRSRLIRNGAGIDAKGRALFLICRTSLNLWEFAEAFRERGCRDALFLDGDISEMLIEPRGKMPAASSYAAMLVVTEKAAQTARQNP